MEKFRVDEVFMVDWRGQNGSYEGDGGVEREGGEFGAIIIIIIYSL